jgi:16S rRNA (cytosine967-C5)-methyltransferase
MHTPSRVRASALHDRAGSDALNARSRAARILVQVINDGRSLSEVLPAGLRIIDDPRERALVQELVYGTLRWHYRLRVVLGSLLKRPLKQRDGDLHCLLLSGLYQLSHMGLPSHAAVNETVQATREIGKEWASGLVNAVLRGYQRETACLNTVIEQSREARHAHPEWLIGVFQADWPADWEQILDAGNQRPPLSLRVNQRQIGRDDYLISLQQEGIKARSMKHADQGIIVDEPVPVEALPGFAAGRVSVQDGAAQLATGLLNLAAGQRVLDACAAPGGKTAHILESEPGLESLTAVELIPGRVRRIEDNLSRLGLVARVIQGDADNPEVWWDGRCFDRILLDAPCTATGVIRRHPDIKLLRRSQDITALASRQARLLGAMWPLLSDGGMLLYTTCSVVAEENDKQIGHFLSTHPNAEVTAIDAAWGRCCVHGRQILPGEEELDGFYFACIRKAI